MDAEALLKIVEMGETSKVQFKEKIAHDDALATEMVAMANSVGGMILLGVKDVDGEIVGIDLKKGLNERISNIASSKVIPPVFVTTEVVDIEGRHVMVIQLPEGGNKPYKTNNGDFWVKQGADKRRLTDNYELMRPFQAGGHIQADEMPVAHVSVKDINEQKFRAYFQKEFEQEIEEYGLTYAQALEAKRVCREGKVSLAGLLFFGRDPQIFNPNLGMKAVSFFGNELEGTSYRDSQDIKGTARDLFDGGMAFFMRNLRHTQQEQGFNSQGKLEVSPIALQELLENALIHRDYFKNAPIRLLIFDDRIEIISPGKLPNSLTVEQIKFGNPVPRNNLMVSYGIYTLPYRGLGSGIRRALKEQPNIIFENDQQGEQFKVTIPRPVAD